MDLLSASSLYIVSAAAALLSPLVYVDPKGLGRCVYYLIFALLIIVTIIALFVGYGAFYEHLESPP